MERHNSSNNNSSGSSSGEQRQANRFPAPGPTARSVAVFLSQLLLIYVVVIVSLYNLTQGKCTEEQRQLWVALLSSCLGYLLPNPSIDKRTLSSSSSG